jgi:hypothetical protein
MVPGANAQSCAVDCGQASLNTLLTSALIFELPLLLSATTSASTASSDDDDSRVAPPCSALHLLLLVDVVPAAMALGDWHMGPGAVSKLATIDRGCSDVLSDDSVRFRESTHACFHVQAQV